MFARMGHINPAIDHRVLENLAKKTQGIEAVEVGSWVGSSALTLAPHFERLYCVDTFQGSPGTHLEVIANEANLDCDGIFRMFCHNVRQHLLHTIVPCVGKSTEWAKAFKYSNRMVDLIFIDADHEYEAVKEDILAWLPHCRQIICGHDYSSKFPGVVQAVQEIFPPGKILHEGTVWWVNEEDFYDTQRRLRGEGNGNG